MSFPFSISYNKHLKAVLTPGNQQQVMQYIQKIILEEWSLRIDGRLGSIQLFPEGESDIEVYENDKLMEYWFKCML
ncbi:hypothetical protein ABDD95_19800 [Mucilaginibacter sp. PAMB04274]|uniref:hypothetical protein n=1 Tax=Mucilaginibacter sp. PAMB04274 TaxID=3138568 RepID=UPI0031F6302D